MNEPTPDLPLLRKVLDYIDAHREQWLQQIWGTDRAILTEDGEVDFDLSRPPSACHTAHCIAGWAVILDGTHEVTFCAGAMYVDGSPSAGPFAQKLLGLTDFEAADLFHWSNDRAEVQRVAGKIAERAGEVL